MFFRNLRKYFWEDEPATTVQIATNIETPITPKVIDVFPKPLPVINNPGASISMKKSPYKNDVVKTRLVHDDEALIYKLRLALAKTKMDLNNIKKNVEYAQTKQNELPTIRSATNTPGQVSSVKVIKKGFGNRELPVIRSADNVPSTLPLIRSATNLPRRRLISTKPINSLNFLASRMKY